MLMRMWRKVNPCTLLVGMQIGTVSLENSMAAPLKTEILYDPETPLMSTYQEETDHYLEKTLKSMFNAVLFTIAKVLKQPKCPSMNELIKKIFYYILQQNNTIQKHRNSAVCNNMDEPGWCYAK